MLRAVILWVIWIEMNRLVLQHGNYKSIRTIDNSIIILIKFWCQVKGNKYIDNLYLILLSDLVHYLCSAQ
jgi:hypothetical protein